MIRIVLAALLGVVLVERKVSEPDLLRGFAFAKCLAEGYKDKNGEFAKDARHVAELYRDAGSTSRPEVYERLTKQAAEANPAKPAAIDGSNLAIMRCLEFYESRGLVRAAKSGR